LVRHGATTAPAGVAIGASDPHLSDAGRDQAAALAAELSGSHLTRIFSSDRVRAIATAQAIAAGRGLQVVVDHRLREIDFGAWEGRRLGDLWSEDSWAAAAWESDLRATPPSFGESLHHLEARVSAFWSDRPRRPQEMVAVVAHRGSLAVLRSLLMGVPLEAAFAAGMALGEAIRVPSGSRQITRAWPFRER
jgi:probable phosphoglycerate mutase